MLLLEELGRLQTRQLQYFSKKSVKYQFLFLEICVQDIIVLMNLMQEKYKTMISM